MEFDRDHNLERYLDLQKFALYVPRCVEIKILRHVRRVYLHAIDATPARWRGDVVDFHTGAAVRPRYCERGGVSHVAAGLSRRERPVLRRPGGTLFGRVARLYEYIPSLYADAACTFHPEHLLGYAAVAALSPRIALLRGAAAGPRGHSRARPPASRRRRAARRRPATTRRRGARIRGIPNGRGRGCSVFSSDLRFVCAQPGR